MGITPCRFWEGNSITTLACTRAKDFDSSQNIMVINISVTHMLCHQQYSLGVTFLLCNISREFSKLTKQKYTTVVNFEVPMGLGHTSFGNNMHMLYVYTSGPKYYVHNSENACQKRRGLIGFHEEALPPKLATCRHPAHKGWLISSIVYPGPNTVDISLTGSSHCCTHHLIDNIVVAIRQPNLFVLHLYV